MADREQPYDPYIPSGHTAPPGGAHQGGDGRTAALQAVRVSMTQIALPELSLALAQSSGFERIQTFARPANSSFIVEDLFNEQSCFII